MNPLDKVPSPSQSPSTPTTHTPTPTHTPIPSRHPHPQSQQKLFQTRKPSYSNPLPFSIRRRSTISAPTTTGTSPAQPSPAATKRESDDDVPSSLSPTSTSASTAGSMSTSSLPVPCNSCQTAASLLSQIRSLTTALSATQAHEEELRTLLEESRTRLEEMEARLQESRTREREVLRRECEQRNRAEELQDLGIRFWREEWQGGAHRNTAVNRHGDDYKDSRNAGEGGSVEKEGDTSRAGAALKNCGEGGNQGIHGFLRCFCEERYVNEIEERVWGEYEGLFGGGINRKRRKAWVHSEEENGQDNDEDFGSSRSGEESGSENGNGGDGASGNEDYGSDSDEGAYNVPS